MVVLDGCDSLIQISIHLVSRMKGKKQGPPILSTTLEFRGISI